ncbi:MAG: hypothetical protein J6L83_07135 [Clostridia bacterium]|nr:hypothetical protein [Clostridia bacterium]
MQGSKRLCDRYHHIVSCPIFGQETGDCFNMKITESIGTLHIEIIVL